MALHNNMMHQAAGVETHYTHMRDMNEAAVTKHTHPGTPHQQSYFGFQSEAGIRPAENECALLICLITN